MNVEKICFYDCPQEHLLLDWKDDECTEENRERHGFRKILLNQAFFCAAPSGGYFDISLFIKEDGNCICELWDVNECVFCFACRDKKQLFDLSFKYVEMVKNLVCMERQIFDLIRETQKDDR